MKLQQNYCGNFSMQHVQPADAGRYVCIVTNEAGTTRDSGRLTVNGMNHTLVIPLFLQFFSLLRSSVSGQYY